MPEHKTEAERRAEAERSRRSEELHKQAEEKAREATKDSGLPRHSEVDEQLPEDMRERGVRVSRDQVGRPQPLQAMTGRPGDVFPSVVSTGRTHHDERIADAELFANPPGDVIPAQDPTPPKAGDKLPLAPDGSLSFTGGAAKLVDPNKPIAADEEGNLHYGLQGEVGTVAKHTEHREKAQARKD